MKLNKDIGLAWPTKSQEKCAHICYSVAKQGRVIFQVLISTAERLLLTCTTGDGANPVRYLSEVRQGEGLQGHSAKSVPGFGLKQNGFQEIQPPKGHFCLAFLTAVSTGALHKARKYASAAGIF